MNSKKEACKTKVHASFCMQKYRLFLIFFAKFKRRDSIDFTKFMTDIIGTDMKMFRKQL